MDSILDSEAMKTFVDMGTDAVNLIAKLADILGGSKTVVLSLSGILTNLFSKTLGT
ncbi:MAG: hypothetical protein J6W64_05190 [Bacilli bacterium]|nr:hypothetical protein [Bacilli bacterium]